MTFRHIFTVLGIVLALTLIPAAQAAHLFIDDSVEAQITLAHDANWEFGCFQMDSPSPEVGLAGYSRARRGSDFFRFLDCEQSGQSQPWNRHHLLRRSGC